jgi:hypothetical protein
MQIEFFPIEELISTDNVKYLDKNNLLSNTKNKQLFQLLKMRLNYDLSNIKSNIFNPYNFIENFLYQYMSDNTNLDTILKFKILSILDNFQYIKLIRSIDSFYDIKEILELINKISLDKYLVIKSDDDYNNNLFNNIKDIYSLLAVSYTKHDTLSDKSFLKSYDKPLLNTPYKLLYIYLSNIYTHFNPDLINIDVSDAFDLINIIYKFSSFKDFQTYLINKIKPNN